MPGPARSSNSSGVEMRMPSVVRGGTENWAQMSAGVSAEGCQPEQAAEKVAHYRSQGYTKFQLKVGGDPDTDIERIRAAAAQLQRGDVLIADANTGWTQHQALRVADAVRDVDVYIEQPCASYRECLAVRRHTDRPFVLDEIVDSVSMLVDGAADGAMDVINLKISKVGGLTRARQMRDLSVSLGIALTIEDTWGGDIVTAAIAHLAHSTPPNYLFTSTDFNSYVTVSIAEGTAPAQAGTHGRSRCTRPGHRAALGRAGQAGDLGRAGGVGRTTCFRSDVGSPKIMG